MAKLFALVALALLSTVNASISASFFDDADPVAEQDPITAVAPKDETPQNMKMAEEAIIDETTPAKEEVEPVVEAAVASAPVVTLAAVQPHLGSSYDPSLSIPSSNGRPVAAPKETVAAFKMPVALKDTMSSSQLAEAVQDLMKIGSLGLSKAEFDATPFGKSVVKIQNLIAKDMMPKVIAAHKGNQQELDKLAREIRKCISTKNSQIKLAGPNNRKYKKTSPTHKTCRTEEASLSTEKTMCWEDEADKRRVRDLKCKAFAMTERKYSNQNANKVIVTKGGSEAAESYLRRISSTICGKARIVGPGGKGGHGKTGFLDEFLKAKIACEIATKNHATQKKKCQNIDKAYATTKAKCNNIQDQMDQAACKYAVDVKDSCEEFAECYKAAFESYDTTERAVRMEEKDRKAEWKGLKRMMCLVKGFMDGKVEQAEITQCKEATHSVAHLVIKYPNIPEMDRCEVPKEYPTTADYKKAQFAPLPALAKGKEGANECTGVAEISTKPAPGSPRTCKCERVTMNGPYSPGPMVKCVNCLDARRTADKISCPVGTKLFSPRSRTDWKTFLASAKPLRAPNWIVDVTRPQNGCGGCTGNSMNSGNAAQKSWVTADQSPWWLRSARYSEPNGDYHANCYLDLWHAPKNSNSVTFNDGSCNYHAKSYYCQLFKVSLKPKAGSPSGCMCEKVELTGPYSAGVVLRCKACLDVRRATQKNSCPKGTKIFAPATRADWKTFITSAQPLRSPHWIIDVTRPQNGCGGCTRSPMKSTSASQATWRTADKAPWWLRSTRYSEPNGDYRANCYLDLWKSPANENSVTWNDGNCNYHANSYYCQKAKKR